MAVYYRPDSLVDQNATDNEKLETLDELKQAVADATAAAATATAAASRLESAIKRAETAAQTADSASSRVGSAIEGAQQFVDESEDRLDAAEEIRVKQEQTRETQEAARNDADVERTRQQAINNTQQAKNNADQAANNQAAMGLPPIDLKEEELDPETRIPIIEGEYGRLYFAPSAVPSENDEAVEWVVKPPLEEDGPRRWERVGSSEVVLPPSIDTDKIQGLVLNSEELSGKGFLNEPGLSYYDAVSFERTKSWVQDNATANSASSATKASKADVADKLGTETVGSTSKPIYLLEGVPQVVEKVAAATKADSADSATSANSATTATTAGNVTGIVAVDHGGTGKTTLVDASNALINALTEGTTDPTDSDYYICQYAGGGTETTTYHRRKMSALWNWIKGKVVGVKVNNATTADKVGTGDVGAANAPIYLKGGVPTAANAYPTIPGAASQDANGLMSSGDKKKLDTITGGAATSVVLANGSTIAISTLLANNIETIRSALGVVSKTANGLMPKLPSDAAAANYLDETLVYSDPMREV